MPKFNNLVGIDGCSKGWILVSGKSQSSIRHLPTTYRKTKIFSRKRTMGKRREWPSRSQEQTIFWTHRQWKIHSWNRSSFAGKTISSGCACHWWRRREIDQGTQGNRAVRKYIDRIRGGSGNRLGTKRLPAKNCTLRCQYPRTTDYVPPREDS